MKKLGILAHQILNSQQYISIAKNLNEICKKYRDIDVILFYNDTAHVSYPNEFAILNSVEALDYDGILIATDPVCAHLLTKCICAEHKYFYIWNIDWNSQQRPATSISDIYLNKENSLIVRSEDHYELVSRIFRQPKHIIEEFNYEQIVKNIVYSARV